jgi:hypothetical protein
MTSLAVSKHLRHAVVIGFCGAALLTPACADTTSPESPQRFENTNEQFAITLTSAWKEMSPQATAAIAKEAGGASAGLTCYAYELVLPQGAPTNAEAYAFIHVDKDDRINESYIARLQHDMSRRRTVLELLASEGVAEKDFLDASFEPDRMLLRISASKTDDEGGRLRFLRGVFFTEQGTITVSCGTAAENYRSLAKTFATAIDTFHVDPSLKYRPRRNTTASAATTAQKSVRVRFNFGFIFVLAAIGLAIARFFANRVSSDEI